ncbi:hypothetical protein HYH03_002400 [Edaphochlamys debaryana]|uniref:Peptidase M11 gametolysin domain-containing protein n=1 Tax=Edaphochlamys debaryana TaxID=47281 RepID=A0A836C4Z8_9CHLO|nr:hypothetical protein HYH03_002400 [Edaphochlamys debaryana]|eukprot:KAG2499453.1 hypothetical protein HYH03_002400 [Edaphochlamys debaryana]
MAPPAEARRLEGASLALLLLTAVMTGSAAARSLTQAATSITISGRLVLKDSHTQPVRWSLKAGADQVYRLPGQPTSASGSPIPPGAFLQLACVLSPTDPKACVSVSGATVNKAAAPTQSTNVVIRSLTMVTSLVGSCSYAGANLGSVQTAMFGGPKPYSTFFRNCSYGSMTFDTAGSKVISVQLPCSAAILGCDEDAVASAALAKARQVLGTTAVAEFSHYAYVMPSGIAKCDWVGLAELPGSQTWYSPTDQGIFNKGTYMQEFIHNFGLYHGWKNGVEYDDLSSAMGYGDSCPSAPELWRLGWAKPLALLSSALLPAGAFRSYALPATALAAVNHVKIQPDWLGGGYTRNVYLALRLKRGGDMDLLPEFDRKVNVHAVNKGIDNSFLASGDPQVSIIGTVGAGAVTDFKAYRLLVKAVALSPDGTSMTVKLCRYAPPSPRPPPSPKPPSPKPPARVASPPPEDLLLEDWPPPPEEDWAWELFGRK